MEKGKESRIVSAGEIKKKQKEEKKVLATKITMIAKRKHITKDHEL